MSKTVFGAKILQADGRSLNGSFQYAIPSNGEPGPWQEVPGNGAYVAVTDGIEKGGYGPLLVCFECRDPTGSSAPEGVVCFRKVRVLPFDASLLSDEMQANALYLRGLTAIPEGLKLPESIGGGLDLRGLTAIPEGLKLPESIGGGLDLSGLDLSGLTAIPEGLKLPESIGGWLDLSGLTAIPEGLKRKYRIMN